MPYQRRAKNAGLGGVEVEGGRVPTSDWMLNLQSLPSGGYQYAPEPPHHYIRWNVGGIAFAPMDELGHERGLQPRMTPRRPVHALVFQCHLRRLKHGIIRAAHC
jgi:hypothetical protein